MRLCPHCQVLSEAVRVLHMPDFQRVTIDQEISTYNANIAAVERLYSQPLPVAYLRHTSRCGRCSRARVLMPIGGPLMSSTQKSVVLTQVPDHVADLPALCAVQHVPVVHAGHLRRGGVPAAGRGGELAPIKLVRFPANFIFVKAAQEPDKHCLCPAQNIGVQVRRRIPSFSAWVPAIDIPSAQRSFCTLPAKMGSIDQPL